MASCDSWAGPVDQTRQVLRLRSRDASRVEGSDGAWAALRLVVLVAAVIIAWAAIITLNASLAPPRFPNVVASTVLTLGVAIQRVNGVQRWLSASKAKRNERVEKLHTYGQVIASVIQDPQTGGYGDDAGGFPVL